VLFSPVFLACRHRRSLSNFQRPVPSRVHLIPKSHRIISFTDPHPLTLLKSYRFKNRGGRVYPLGPQVLLLSKLKAPINHAESTLLQVFFLKNLKPFAINTYEKHGRVAQRNLASQFGVALGFCKRDGWSTLNAVR
jgi:hypothetical protein